MAKKYTGSLSLDWFNNQKSILVQPEEAGAAHKDVPAPKINWINKDEALFYEIVDEEGRGLLPYWVDRSDLRVKEARPLVFQKAYKAEEKPKAGSLIDKEYKLVESDRDTPAIENMLIRGDNLLALSALKKLFANRPDEEKVKCIFIDPPYNTGAAFEQYDDNLAHSEWLTLIRDRLDVLKAVLRQDGSIWISIDDDESHYLKVLLDSMFGRENFVANVVWQKKSSPQPNATWLSDSHDHILIYAKDKSIWKPNKLPRTDEQNAIYRHSDEYDGIDELGKPYGRGGWYPGDATASLRGGQRGAQFARTGFSSNIYEITAPSGRTILPPAGTCWRYSKERFEELLNDKRITFGSNGNNRPCVKRFLSELQDRGVVPMTVWHYEEVGENRVAAAEVKNFNEEEPFTTPKPERLVHRILHISSEVDDLILDCFGGSGTTFAVAHKMNRRWIGVEIGKHADTHIIPRLKKVLSGEDQSGISKAVNWQGGGGFKYYTLGDSIIDHATRDFNWRLGRDFIEKSLLSSYDFAPDPEFSFPQAELIAAAQRPSIGFHRVGQKQMAGVISLIEPKKGRPITYDELMAWYGALKKFKGTQSIMVFTNRGVEIAYDSKPEDLEVIKVPHAIFAELEK